MSCKEGVLDKRLPAPLCGSQGSRGRAQTAGAEAWLGREGVQIGVIRDASTALTRAGHLALRLRSLPLSPVTVPTPVTGRKGHGMRAGLAERQRAITEVPLWVLPFSTRVTSSPRTFCTPCLPPPPGTGS